MLALSEGVADPEDVTEDPPEEETDGVTEPLADVVGDTGDTVGEALTLGVMDSLPVPDGLTLAEPYVADTEGVGETEPEREADSEPEADLETVVCARCSDRRRRG